LNNTKLKVLKSVRDLNQPSITDIKEEVGTSRKNVNDHLSDLEDRGLINVKKTSHTHIRSVTSEGEDFLLDNLSDLNEVNSSGKQEDPYFIHFFSVRCEFQSSEMLSEDWRERFKEFEDLQVEEHKDFNRIQVKEKQWVYRLTGRSLEVKVRNEVSGKDVKTLKDRAWSKAMEGLDHLENLIGQDIPRDMFQVEVMTQHVGARRRHICKAFVDHIDQNTVSDPRDFRVLEGDQDEDDRIRIYCDASGPGGMLEAEAGNGGQINGRMDTAEDDMALLEDVTNDMIEDPEASRRLLDSPERIDQVEKNIERVEDTVESLSRSVKEGMEEVSNTVENNLSEGPQVQKQVMEMKQVQEGLQEELEEVKKGIEKMVEVTEQNVAVQSSRSRSDQEIIEKLEEISSKASSSESVVNPLADHVEISNKWEDRWGNIRAYSPELEKQFKLIDSEDM